MKKIWLDLELRQDIDDLITLLFALEKKIVGVISIHNPSINEIKLIEGILSLYSFSKINQPKLIINGTITEYKIDFDIHVSLFKFHTNNKLEWFKIEDFLILYKESLKDYIYFNGGSLNTIGKIIELESTLDIYIQGGYAGPSILEKEDVLEKFKNRESVPSWNVNLDYESTKNILKNTNANIKFISKNICHSSLIGLEDIENKDTILYNVLKSYFGSSDRKKCMHDVLAFFAIIYPNLIQFKKIDLIDTLKQNKIHWQSIENNKSNKQISVRYDYNKFKRLFNEF